MNILITGANGYIGSRLLQLLLDRGHRVYAVMRSKFRFSFEHPSLTVLEIDFLSESPIALPEQIDVAYYLIHAMSYGSDFPAKEEKIINSFLYALEKTTVKQLVYLGALSHSSTTLSAHFASRLNTEKMIKESGIPFTILKAGIIIGAGSASFEIIRDLVEKLPLMVAPKWIDNPCQPVAIEDVLYYLEIILLQPKAINQVFEIGGPSRLSYKEMLLEYAEIRKLKRTIFVVPVLTPRLSSYWLYFVTSVNFRLAQALVHSLKVSTKFDGALVQEMFPHQCLDYRESVKKALDVIEQNPFVPSWKDALISNELEHKLCHKISIPVTSCFIDRQEVPSSLSKHELIERVWQIGGRKGWYYMNWAWRLRGVIDKVFGGVGLQRGRGSDTALKAGCSLDFWRVLIADKEEGHLLLYAEMKLPGEAWLEFKVRGQGNHSLLIQTASFRPKGIGGRCYWYFLYPLHFLIFRGMAQNVAKS
ncbi:MAG: SDR family oxidoreductase [Parachlamydiaceae bacterium]